MVVDVAKSFTEHEIVPDVVTKAPKDALSVIYPRGVQVLSPVS